MSIKFHSALFAAIALSTIANATPVTELNSFNSGVAQATYQKFKVMVDKDMISVDQAKADLHNELITQRASVSEIANIESRFSVSTSGVKTAEISFYKEFDGIDSLDDLDKRLNELLSEPNLIVTPLDRDSLYRDYGSRKSEIAADSSGEYSFLRLNDPKYLLDVFNRLANTETPVASEVENLNDLDFSLLVESMMLNRDIETSSFNNFIDKNYFADLRESVKEKDTSNYPVPHLNASDIVEFRDSVVNYQMPIQMGLQATSSGEAVDLNGDIINMDIVSSNSVGSGLLSPKIKVFLTVSGASKSGDKYKVDGVPLRICLGGNCFGLSGAESTKKTPSAGPKQVNDYNFMRGSIYNEYEAERDKSNMERISRRVGSWQKARYKNITSVLSPIFSKSLNQKLSNKELDKVRAKLEEVLACSICDKTESSLIFGVVKSTYYKTDDKKLKVLLVKYGAKLQGFIKK